MEFQSEDEAYNFYNRYGLVVRFNVRKDYLNKDKDGVVTLRREIMKYQVRDLVIEHNHTLRISECVHMMRSQRKVSISQGAQAEIANDARIFLKQFHEKEAGGLGNIGYTRDDLDRYLRTKRERGLKYGETGTMLRYFEELVHYSSLFVI
ncbi:protein FAR1-RELATED SEQUENCE 5-like [Coffea arabica]|uniref:Protein FAR1-RELATED SEQUENCE 5-like n=1 Tax=Coffea arabica TaxID=13443 RepID=A0ABM4WQ40_COFAR